MFNYITYQFTNKKIPLASWKNNEAWRGASNFLRPFKVQFKAEFWPSQKKSIPKHSSLKLNSKFKKISQNAFKKYFKAGQERKRFRCRVLR